MIAQWIVEFENGEECVYILHDNGVLTNETSGSRVSNIDEPPMTVERCRELFMRYMRGKIILEEIN
jgi:hypothetical protein